MGQKDTYMCSDRHPSGPKKTFQEAKLTSLFSFRKKIKHQCKECLSNGVPKKKNSQVSNKGIWGRKNERERWEWAIWWQNWWEMVLMLWYKCWNIYFYQDFKENDFSIFHHSFIQQVVLWMHVFICAPIPWIEYGGTWTTLGVVSFLPLSWDGISLIASTANCSIQDWLVHKILINSSLSTYYLAIGTLRFQLCFTTLDLLWGF